MSDRFEDCLAFVLRWEGAYVSHPLDRGGPTNRGVTQKTYDAYRTSRGMGRQPVSGLSGDELRDIYRTQYWTAAHCPKLLPPIDLVVFDSAVNCGVKQATKFLQRALCVPADGVFGFVTEGALNACAYPPEEIANRVIEQRDAFYEKLIEGDPRQAVFEKGWRRRLDALRDEL